MNESQTQDPAYCAPVTEQRGRWPAVVLLQTMEGSPEVRVPPLVEGLAADLVKQFGDRVLVLELVGRRGGVAASPTPQFHQDAPSRVTLALSADVDKAIRELSDWLGRYGRRFAYTFLEPSRCSAAVRNGLVKGLAGFYGGSEDLHLRLVWLDARPALPEEAPLERPVGWSMLRTRFLRPDAPRPKLTARKLLEMLRERASQRAGAMTRYDAAHVYKYVKASDERVRVTMDLRKPDAPQGSFGLWSRAVSNRRVGLALGGCGAWGYAHVALIDRLLRLPGEVEPELRPEFVDVADPHAGLRVPVDLIAGVSSGSLMGGYYAALGVEGLKLVRDRGARIELALALAMVSSITLELVVAADTGLVELEDLETMMFPVTTNLSEMRPEFVSHTTLPWGLRASGSAPGVFAPTISERGIYVDGAISDNVPATLVDWLGGDLVVASNPLPPPEGMKGGHLPKNRLLRALYATVLLRPAQLMTSFTLMLQRMGVAESSTYLVYDATARMDSLLGAFDFSDAEKMYREVLKDKAFRETVREARRRYAVLAAPRVP